MIQIPFQDIPVFLGIYPEVDLIQVKMIWQVLAFRMTGYCFKLDVDGKAGEQGIKFN